MVESLEQTENPTPEPPKKPGLLRRLLRPSKKKAIGLAALASVLGLGYYGAQRWAKQNLPGIIETQAENFLGRPVDIGEIKSISPVGVKIGESSLPALPGEADRVEIKQIDVGFNLLPVIFKRTLPLEITLVEPNIYVDQQADGSWLTLNLPESEGDSELPIDFDITANLDSAKVTAVPYQQDPINITADGSGRYTTTEEQLVGYDLDADINNAPVTLQGETILSTGKTDTKVLVKDLALDDVVSLVPNLPLDLNSGVLNADLDLDIPSWKEITSAEVEGTLNLQQVAGELEPTQQKVKARSRLNLGGRDIEVNQTEATIGDLTARVTGEVDLDRGYNLDLRVLPVDLTSLQKTFNLALPVPVTGEADSQVEVRGAIKEPTIKGRIASTKPITIDKERFARVDAIFQADRETITLQNLTAIPEAGGSITAEGLVETDLADTLANQQPIDITQMPLSVNFKANLPTADIVAPYYQLPSEVQVGNLIAEGNIGGTISELKALANWQLQEGAIATDSTTQKISGAGELLYVEDNILLRDTALNIGEGRAELAASANLREQVWQGAVNTSQIYLTPFLSQLPVEGLDLTRPISIRRTNINLSGKLDDLAPQSIKGVANVAFNLDGGLVDFNSRFADGVVNAQADTGNLAVHKFVPALKIPVTTKVSSLLFESDIEPLLNIVETKDFSSIKSSVTLEAFVADGRLVTSGNLDNNQWQAEITGDDINTDRVVAAYAPDLDLAYALQPIDTQGRFSGSLDSFDDEVVNLPVRIENAAVQMGRQNISSRGSVTVNDLLGTPNIPLANLAVTSQLDFDTLPVAEVVERATQDNQLLAERLNLRGDAFFDGNFQARNLISDPANLDNYRLVGDLRFNDFAFNDTVFDPVMTGAIDVRPNQVISFNLQGQQDVIAASATPCDRRDCRLPYLPSSLEFRQGEDTANPILATGSRQGDLFDLDIENFPLAVLNLAPARQVGIDGALAGTVTGEVTANLFTFAADGNILVQQPAIGYIEAERLAADFVYDPQQNIARVNSADFDFGNSEYDFRGGVNLATGDIDGRLDITEGYVQDIFTTLGWYTVQDALDLFQRPDYVAARNISTQPIATASESVAQKLALLRTIENQIQQQAEEKKKVSVPTELDIQGQYGGGVTLDGTIQQPEIAFNLQGNDWQWQAQQEYLDIIPPLGLVKQANQLIPIQQLIAVGEVRGTTVDLEEAKLQIDDSIVSAAGKLSTTVQDANYQVENLTVDTIGKFIEIPVDIAGRIDSEGTIQGTLSQPNIIGNLTVSNSAYNGTTLPTTVKGKYVYRDRNLDFNTTEPSEIQIAATVPYPIEPDNNTLTAKAKLEKEAFALIDAFAGGNITWIGGEGDADLSATANLDLDREGNPLYNLDAVGVVNLEEAQVSLNTPFFSAPIVATGQVDLNNQVLSTENLAASFAEKDVTLSGALPILYAVNNLENPLTVTIPEGEIELEKLYEGGVSGEIIVTSAALTPTVGGKVNLIDGKVSIPKNNQEETYTLNVNRNTNNTANPPTTEASGFVTTLDDLTIALQDFKLQQSPLYEFGIEGDLTLNGTADTPSNIRPEGTIYLTQGDVDWLSSNFTLVRNRENTIAFSPEEGVLNPYVDIRFKTEVSQVDNVRQLSRDNNEIPDPISQVGRTELINIVLAVDGEVSELIPALAATPEGNCTIRANDVPPTNNYAYSQSELDKLAQCVNVAASDRTSARQLLDSPVVTLESTPSRSEGEIVSLLGNQFLDFAERLQNSNEEELVELGVTQFVIAPIQRRLFYRVEDFVVDQGQKVGLDYLRVYPYLEGIYEINRDSAVRGTYDYVFNEVKFEYQRQF